MGRVWQPAADNNDRLARFKFKKSWPNELIFKDLLPGGISKPDFEMPSYFDDES